MDDHAFLRGALRTADGVELVLQLMPFVAMLAILVLGVVLAFRRRWVWAAVCVAVACGAYVLDYRLVRGPDSLAAQAREAAAARVQDDLERRAREVAAFERTPLQGDYPPVLEVHGSLTRKLTRRLLTEGLFTEIRVNESARREDDWTVYRLSDVPECRPFDLGYREPETGPDPRDDRVLRECFRGEEVRLAGEGVAADAVVYLVDHETTLGARSGWSRGRIELRVRRGGEDRLVDYWEAPYVPVKRRSFSRVGRTPPHAELDELAFIRAGLGR